MMMTTMMMMMLRSRRSSLCPVGRVGPDTSDIAFVAVAASHRRLYRLRVRRGFYFAARMAGAAVAEAAASAEARRGVTTRHRSSTDGDESRVKVKDTETRAPVQRKRGNDRATYLDKRAI
jgi:hypothetical protein